MEEPSWGRRGFREKDEGDGVSRKVDVDEDLRSTLLQSERFVVLGRGPRKWGAYSAGSWRFQMPVAKR